MFTVLFINAVNSVARSMQCCPTSSVISGHAVFRFRAGKEVYIGKPLKAT